MNQQKIDTYFAANSKFFPEEKMGELNAKLATTSEEKFSLLSATKLKDPTTLLVVSILLGTLGVDRFMLGNIGMGVLKLLTLGCCYVLTIIDWVTVKKRTKEANFNQVIALL